jgi:hypothetical protein
MSSLVNVIYITSKCLLASSQIATSFFLNLGAHKNHGIKCQKTQYGRLALPTEISCNWSEMHPRYKEFYRLSR